jgi:AcrR family transcriptional regulator
MTWERARSEEQKKIRINEILAATAKLYDSHDYENITFAAIAKEADFTRSNLYKYFTNKEEIFLELLIIDIKEWRKDLLKVSENKKISIALFASSWVKLQVKHKRMGKLYTILYTFLEKKASLESLIHFKKAIMKEFTSVIKALIHAFPALTEEKAMKLLLSILALSTGTYPLFNQTEKQLKAMNSMKIKHDQRYYKEVYEDAVTILIQGIIKD